MTSTTTLAKPTALTAFDRCDRCGARAYVRVTLLGGDLLFCGHHARAHRAAFSQQATAIHDETEKISTNFGTP